MAVTITPLVGPEVLTHIDALAKLRIEVFRDFPYLYDGDREYERKYLQTYCETPESLVVLVFDDDNVVGASTAVPMEHEAEEFQKPFLEHNYDISKVFYCGESVLQPAYRGQGIGVRFFAERESYARKLGRFDWICFCAVDRPADHPRRPPDYVPQDAFWSKRGFRRHPELQTHFVWRDLDESEESPKPMTFWMKRLND